MMTPDSSSHLNTTSDIVPPIGMTPPQVLAQEAASGRRGAAWRLLHWIMADDPRAVEATASLDDDRLAQHFLEFIAIGTWAGKPFVVPGSFRTSHARTRLRTLFLFGAGMDPARAERVLIATTHDTRPAVREAAIHILGIMGRPALTPVLIDALNDPTYTVRMQAVKALGRTGDAKAVPALLRLLHTDDEQLGSQIYLALVHLGIVAVPGLLVESSSRYAWVRWHCMRALGEIGDRRAMPTLVQALSDTDHAIAWVGAKGLARMGKECLAPVLRLLVTTETSPWLVETASYVLHQIYIQDSRLRPYLEPVMQSMHGVAYHIATPDAARKALSQLIADGKVTVVE